MHRNYPKTQIFEPSRLFSLFKSASISTKEIFLKTWQKFLFLFVLSSQPLMALFTGNPSEPDIIDQGFFIPECSWFGLKLGYEGDYIFDRKLRAHKHQVRGRIDEFQMHWDQGVVTLNLLNRFEVYGSVGSMNAYITHRPHIDMKRREYQTSDHLLWGVGARLLFFNWECASLGIDGKFQRGYPHVKWNALDGVAFTTDAELDYREFQVSIGVSYEVNIFVPYIAFKYSSATATLSKVRPNMELGTSHFKMRSREHLGLSLGVSLSPGKYFDFDFEAQLFDEQGITFTGNVKF